jgi:chaperonin GroES
MSKINFQPLGKRVLVKTTEALNKTAGGIIIPDNVSKDKPTTAQVQAVSDKIDYIKTGDNVVFTAYSGSEIELDSKKYIVLETKEILGVIK